MATTPEGKVKRKVSDYLKTIDGLWYTMPVPGGYGQSTLDYIGCYRGQFFAIETKAPGNKPTARQEHVMAGIHYSGGQTFVVDDYQFDHLRKWIAAVRQRFPREAGSGHRSTEHSGAGGEA